MRTTDCPPARIRSPRAGGWRGDDDACGTRSLPRRDVLLAQRKAPVAQRTGSEERVPAARGVAVPGQIERGGDGQALEVHAGAAHTGWVEGAADVADRAAQRAGGDARTGVATDGRTRVGEQRGTRRGAVAGVVEARGGRRAARVSG